MKERDSFFVEYGGQILLGGFLAPIACGILTGVLFGDFSAGAGAGAFLMIGSWFLLFIIIVLGR